MPSIPNPLPSNDAAPAQAITGGALNLTKATFFVATVTEILTGFDGIFAKVFGDDPPKWVKPAVMLTIVVVWGMIATADILARGYAHAHGLGEPVTLPQGLLRGMKVSIDKNGADTHGQLVALRANGASVDLLVLTDAEGLEWAPAPKVKHRP